MLTKKIIKSEALWLPWLVPALIIYILFMAFPLFDSLRLSMYTGSAGLGRSFIGLDNYRRLFTAEQYSQRYWGAFSNTVVFFIIHMTVQNYLGIFFALLLTGKLTKGKQFFQTVISFLQQWQCLLQVTCGN